jgi:hypothetical protein
LSFMLMLAMKRITPVERQFCLLLILMIIAPTYGLMSSIMS